MNDVPPQEKFTGRAAHYADARPAYAEALLDRLCAELDLGAGTPVADIGAGTGIFSGQLLRRGCTVFGVEPNDEMRAFAESRLAAFPRFRAVKGDAAKTALPDKCVRLVTAAQAFHWFPAEEFRAECARIADGGRVALVYNHRTDAPIHAEIFAANERFCPNFRGYSGGMTKRRISDFFRGKFSEISAPNPISLDRGTFLRRQLSASYALRESDENFAAWRDALLAVFSRREKNGRVAFPLESAASFGVVE